MFPHRKLLKKKKDIHSHWIFLVFYFFHDMFMRFKKAIPGILSYVGVSFLCFLSHCLIREIEN